jgi:hypothetical protein
MPRKSQKSLFIEAIYHDAALSIMNLDSSEESEAEQIEFDCLVNVVQVARYELKYETIKLN